ncbi:GntR family transcriptional regulator [Pseudoxanthobacter sp. M-2]|uniref:GntR family transcriptional regulator n=1 Tax=Pseudoxanthobacter sp. M-2 TaxID=3078754 RepID=UPI0038FCB3CB
MADVPLALASPLQQSSLVEQIYRRLQHALMHGQMLPHQRLKVRELAASLGTSETPVREALFQLVRDRAIEIKSRHYVRVRRPTAREYLQIREVRLRLEPLAAASALPNLAEADIASLERLQSEFCAAQALGRYDDALRLGVEFHFGLYRRSENPVLIGILESLWCQIVPVISLPYLTRHSYDVTPHDAALAAIRAGDPVALARAIEADLMLGSSVVIGHLLELEEGETRLQRIA